MKIKNKKGMGIDKIITYIILLVAGIGVIFVITSLFSSEFSFLGGLLPRVEGDEYFCTSTDPGSDHSADWRSVRLWGEDHHKVAKCPPIGATTCPCLPSCNTFCQDSGYKFGGKMVVGLLDYDSNNPEKKPYRCVCLTEGNSNTWYCRGGHLNAEWSDSMDKGKVYGTETQWCSDPYVADNEQACDNKCIAEGFTDGEILGTKQYSIKTTSGSVQMSDWDDDTVPDFDFDMEEWKNTRRCQCS